MFSTVKKIAVGTAALAVGIVPAFAEGTMALPETGVDVVSLIGTSVTAMGTIAAAGLCGYAAFLLVRKGIRWLGKSLG